MQLTGERQVAPTTSGIRRDHVARYEWAAKILPPRSRVVDFACGVGYGTQILAEAGHSATGFDKCPEAIAYAEKFYGRKAQFRRAADECPLRAFDVAVCFETIEHVTDPHRLLRSFLPASILLASVPNEEVIPYGAGFAFHLRHYTKAEFEQLLTACGWEVMRWYGQEGPESEVVPDMNGRTLIAVCQRAGGAPVTVGDDDEAPDPEPAAAAPAAVAAPAIVGAAEAPVSMADWPVPEHVALLGLGGSLEQFSDITKRLGGSHAYCDEVWAINAVAGTYIADRIFHMDDVAVQELRAQAKPESNIARMLEWLKVHPGPIVTSVARKGYPGLVPYPIEDVLSEFKIPYFNSTAAWAVAYAVHLGVKRLSIFGCDFSYPDVHHAERGRACVEFWLGVGFAKGMVITIARGSTLMDAMCSEADRLYGYDAFDLTLRRTEERVYVDFVEKPLPSAEEMERRYDHSRPVAQQVGGA